MSVRTLVLLIVFLGVAAMAARPAFDSDTWWHLRAGQWIVENRQIPQTDPFSHTMRGSPWRYPGWLAQVVMLGFYRVGGLQGLTVFSAVFVGLAFALLWPLLEGPILLRAAVTLLAAATSAVYWAARPHIVSFALAVFFLWALEQRRRRIHPRAVWLLPLAMAVWVNVHGGFAIGFVLILMYLAAILCDLVAQPLLGRTGWAEAWALQRPEIVVLGGVFLLSLVAAAVNPHGPAILTYPLRTVSIPVLQEHILEWQPPDFRLPQLLPFLAMLLVLLVTLGISRRAAKPVELITTAGWTALALLAVRHVPIFALTAAPVISLHASEVLRAARSGVAEDHVAGERRTLNAALGAVLVCVSLVWFASQISPSRNRDYLESQVPLKAMAALHQIDHKGNLLNDYNWGGYVLWDLYPSYPSFVDGRTDVFSPAVLDDYLRLWTAGQGWESILDRYDIGVVLLPPQAPLLSTLRQSGWVERFGDEAAVVLTRPETG